MRHSLVLALVCAVALPLFAACNSAPTLPLPPPVVSVGEPNTQGLVLIEGEVNARAFVLVFNERTEAGVITRADQKGHFQAELEAAVGDLLTVWQQIDDETGERKQTVVPPPREAPAM